MNEGLPFVQKSEPRGNGSFVDFKGALNGRKKAYKAKCRLSESVEPGNSGLHIPGHSRKGFVSRGFRVKMLLSEQEVR